ncbi:cupin domain-containing protein [Pseudoruegeria sp. HB172150]|uniref:cupin domain-containing protein n=1 Tax=Pseudoruegeria sp. HB172150 TaxID=2721164 RepID=UPI001555448D|nr:cupin domain-containing protein [Pseudoruegeria sp. HB172150]
MEAQEIIDRLNLSPHPEGGWFRQTWIAEAEDGARPAGTCIYFLLQSGERSHWHRVDATEIWHYYAGSPLNLHIAATEAGPAKTWKLGPNLASAEAPQRIVPLGHWQAAETTGAWTLVGCTVSPAFRFEGFELADPGFDIPRG